MTSVSGSVRRGGAAAVAAAAALGVALAVLISGAAPARADDLIDLEDWFGGHGYDNAYLEYDEGDDGGQGIAFSLFYDTQADGPEAYRTEARDAARRIWERADYRVVKVQVSGASSVEWANGLPPTVSFNRAEMRAAFGPRPAEKDAEGEAELAGDFSDAPPPEVIVGAVVIGGLALAVGGFLGWLVTYLALRRRPPIDTWGAPPWAASPAWGTPGWSGSGWSGSGWGGAGAPGAPRAPGAPAAPIPPWTGPPYGTPPPPDNPPHPPNPPEGHAP